MKKIWPKKSAITKKTVLLQPLNSDSVAQQVEHNTFNVGVLGSSPSRVTKKQKISDQVGDFLLFLPTQ